MKSIIFILLLIFVHVQCVGQTKVFEKQILNTCNIQFKSSSGSGLFYSDSTNLYLITATHVLCDIGPTGVFLKDSIVDIISFSRDISNNDPDTITINLLKAQLLHKIKIDSIQDIAVIQIANLDLRDKFEAVTYHSFVHRLDISATRINCFTNDHILGISEINLGDDIAIFGFPTSLSTRENPQFDYKRPLIRKGSIAGLNTYKGTIILDCPVYPGNSGGPVIRTYYDLVDLKNGFAQVVRTGLIGIVIQFIPLVEKWENRTFMLTNTEYENSGYSVAVPIDYAMKLIDKF